jgi:hypothetical protein
VVASRRSLAAPAADGQERNDRGGTGEQRCHGDSILAHQCHAIGIGNAAVPDMQLLGRIVRLSYWSSVDVTGWRPDVREALEAVSNGACA